MFMQRRGDILKNMQIFGIVVVVLLFMSLFQPMNIVVSSENVDLPENMVRAIAKQAEAERERRAKIIHAEGEFQAAANLRKAANVISGNPQALQLRFLGTLSEIATEKNSTIVFPLPLDFLKAFSQKNEEKE